MRCCMGYLWHKSQRVYSTGKEKAKQVDVNLQLWSRAAGAAAAAHQAPRSTLHHDNDINTMELLEIWNKTQ